MVLLLCCVLVAWALHHVYSSLTPPLPAFATDDCLLINTLRIASGLSLRSYARSSLKAQRAALTYRVISASSDPIIVSAAHLANPFTHRIVRHVLSFYSNSFKEPISNIAYDRLCS